jgi:translation initiation factor IF-1
MNKNNKIQFDGKVIKTNPSTNFDVQLEANDFIVNCNISGKLRINQVKVLTGDRVVVEISPYDVTKGRIVWRY